MSNPFKTGDKVIPCDGEYLETWLDYGVTEVVKAYDIRGIPHVDVYDRNGSVVTFYSSRFRAAIAGKDYDVPQDWRDTTYAGHLADGSSVQAHSAGPLYPVVLVYRDAQFDSDNKYDVGVISPRNSEPLWLSSVDAAVAVAEIIKKDIK